MGERAKLNYIYTISSLLTFICIYSKSRSRLYSLCKGKFFEYYTDFIPIPSDDSRDEWNVFAVFAQISVAAR